MRESPPSPDGNVPVAAQRAVRWDAIAAIIAASIGLLALCVSGYTAYIQRQQVRAQVWPYLLWASSDTSSQYLWVNKGVGPAQVKSMQVLVDGKPQHDWKTVMRSLQIDPQNYGQSTFNGNVMSAGETLEWLKFKDHSDFQVFRNAATRMKLGFRVCYCSTLGDCWMVDTTQGNGNSRLPVGTCPAVPESAQFDD
jgi:hypothetical protein